MPPASVSGLPDAIDGLDVQAGLSHMMGKKSLYLAMLQRYVTGQRDCAVNIRLALAADDATTAQRVAHTLKGVSGTIGAKDISALAGAVEAAIREQQGSDRIAHALNELATPLGALTGTLHDWLAVHAPL